MRKAFNSSLVTIHATLLEKSEQLQQITFKVKSMDKNFFLSPISMALLMMGSSFFTASSMGTGGTFSPPAVMINSKCKA